jgi:hypothetical protein
MRAPDVLGAGSPSDLADGVVHTKKERSIIAAAFVACSTRLEKRRLAEELGHSVLGFHWLCGLAFL